MLDWRPKDLIIGFVEFWILKYMISTRKSIFYKPSNVLFHLLLNGARPWTITLFHNKDNACIVLIANYLLLNCNSDNWMLPSQYFVMNKICSKSINNQHLMYFLISSLHCNWSIHCPDEQFLHTLPCFVKYKRLRKINTS